MEPDIETKQDYKWSGEKNSEDHNTLSDVRQMALNTELLKFDTNSSKDLYKGILPGLELTGRDDFSWMRGNEKTNTSDGFLDAKTNDGNESNNLSSRWEEGSRIMLIGEDAGGHENGQPKEELIKHFEELRKGPPPTDYMAFEMIPEGWEKNLDLKDKDPEAYKIAKEELIKEMMEAAPLSAPDASESDKKAAVERYISMVEAAHDAGLKVLGLEKHHMDLEKIVSNCSKVVESGPEGRKAFEDYVSDKNADKDSPAGKELTKRLVATGLSEEDARRVLDNLDIMKKSDFNFDKFKNIDPKEFELAFAEEINAAWRNKNWEDKLGEILEREKDAHIAVYAGRGHFDTDGYREDLKEALEPTLTKRLSKYKPTYVKWTGET